MCGFNVHFFAESGSLPALDVRYYTDVPKEVSSPVCTLLIIAAASLNLWKR